MANTVTIGSLSASTNGRMIKVTATTSGTANTIHTATNTAGKKHRVYLWATSTALTSAASPILTIMLGGASDPDDLIYVTISNRSGMWPVLDGVVLDGGVIIKAFADAANVVNLYGHVMEITA